MKGGDTFSLLWGRIMKILEGRDREKEVSGKVLIAGHQQSKIRTPDAKQCQNGPTNEIQK
jgi:hypothetical protein